MLKALTDGDGALAESRNPTPSFAPYTTTVGDMPNTGLILIPSSPLAPTLGSQYGKDGARTVHGLMISI